MHGNSTDDALSHILNGDNVAILGGAGRGKSTLIKSLNNFFGNNMLKVAATGAAAIQVSGSTMHRTFGLAFEPFIEGVTLKKNLRKERAAILKSPEIQMLVIDEIGAVRVDRMVELDWTLRKYRDKTKPFGGLQVICTGDYLQLPPVITDVDRTLMQPHYNSPYAFDAQSYKDANFKTVVLTHNFRQEDSEQQKILDYLRLGENKQQVVEYLNDLCYNRKTTENAVVLCPTNKMVDEKNQFHLENLKGKSTTFKARVKGDFKEEPSPKILELKVGCRVLTTINDENDRFVNGSSGTVVKIDRFGVHVELDSGDIIELEPKTQYNYELYVDALGKVKERIIGSYTQIPLRLGAAISIHRSQGMTLQQVDLSLGNYPLFGNSMLYVAVSRCRNLNNLKINRRLTTKDILVDNYVSEYMKQFM